MRRSSLYCLIAAVLCCIGNGSGALAAEGAEAPLTIKLIAFNDFHGAINPPTAPTPVDDPRHPGRKLSLPTGGVEYLSTLIAQLKAQNPLNAVVAAGDLIGASPLVSALLRDEPTLDLLGRAGLEFSAAGNHEFDAGWEELLRKQRSAGFRYLAANVIVRKTGERLLPAYAIKEFAGRGGSRVAVAFIGLVLSETPSIVVADRTAGLEFADEATAANAAVAELRQRGIRSIVVLIHEGGRTSDPQFDDTGCRDFSGRIKQIAERLDPAIDLIVSGHTHRSYICRLGGRLITSAGAEGRFVTDIDLTVDPRTGDVIRTAAQQRAVVNDEAPNPLPGRYPTLAKDARLTALVNSYNQKAAPLAARKVGTILTDITRHVTPAGESALGNLIADAQLDATRSPGSGAAQLALMNSGGVRTDLHSARGFITYGDLFAVHPFSNALVTLSLTGEQLRLLLEEQWTRANTVLQISEGFSYTWDAAAPPGARVDPGSMKLHGVAIDMRATYRVTVNDFLASGGNGFSVLTQGREPQRGILDVEALERYIRGHPSLRAPATNRIVRRN
ncbi:MAG TPA: bifunctional metallophosphatase/5'-nucleotidase [Steroidobacteraceae bacterium]|nr:bifunctional metallophosphatase/5'-nucleotidase [Steroidobacteraceae bacterium]